MCKNHDMKRLWVRTEKSVMWGVFQWGLVEQERVQVDEVDISV